MKAYKCDRCGNFYAGKTNSENAFCKLRDYDMRYIPLDLCPDCITELIKWFNMEESNDNTTSESQTS